MKLSIVIPVYNEVNTIAEIVRSVCEIDINMEKELILIDDGSTDGTQNVILNLEKEHPQCKIVFHEKNMGKGAAVRSGFLASSGDIILIQDADLEYDPHDYSVLLAPILNGHADVVYGSRFIGGGAHRVIFFWHYVGNRILTTLSNMMTNLNLTDMETCYKVFKKDILNNITLHENRFGFEVEITAKIARGKWKIYEVPVSYYGRDYREGKKITWKDGVRAFWCIFKYRVI